MYIHPSSHAVHEHVAHDTLVQLLPLPGLCVAVDAPTQVDADGSGALSFDEFQVLIEKVREARGEVRRARFSPDRSLVISGPCHAF